jgi:hypothetical protein
MIDGEVERLRRLRGSALRVRAVARTLHYTTSCVEDPLVRDSGLAAWRIARTVTGRLRAHPHIGFQRDASLVILLRNSLRAAASALTAWNRRRALQGLVADLGSLARELDDVRALTWWAEFSDSLGRSQAEVRAILAAFDSMRLPGTRAITPRAVSQATHPAKSAPAPEDWPYLAI